MGLFPLVTHSSGLRFGYESGNVSGVYSKSATSITALKGSNQVIHLQYRTLYTIVFGLEAGQATLSGIKSSDGTVTFNINFANSTSDDSKYNNLTPNKTSVQMKNIDDGND